MERVALLILLLTLVYSWEETKYVLLTICSKILGRNKQYNKNSETDSLVSDLVLIATIPLTLGYLIMATDNLSTKLLVILVEFVFLGLLLRGLDEFYMRRRFTQHYQGLDKISALVYSLAGLVSPTTHFAVGVSRRTIHPGKYLLHLALPLAVGLGLALTARYVGMDEFSSRIDQLIAIATLGLILNVTIDMLEKIFRRHRIHVAAMFRVLLGVVLVFALISLN